MLAQNFHHREEGRQRVAEQRPERLGFGRIRQRLQDALLRLRAHAGQHAQALGLRRLLERDERGDAELAPDAGGGLRAEAGQPHEGDDVRRNELLVLGQRLRLAELDDLDDLALDRLANPLQLLGAAVQSELRDRAAGLADPGGSATVGQYPEGVEPLDLEDVREQLELLGDVCVRGQARRHGAMIRAHVHVTVCLPTYNEHRNIEPMLRALGAVLPTDGRVLVIDDSSPDGTGRLAERLAAELGYVDVLHRKRKEGLGPAYLAGFRRALADGAELVLEMDCDFSHNPADVPRLIQAAGGADLVLGSRYVAGGRIENWSTLRQTISAGGSLYARVLLGTRVRDLTGGFKCYRRAVLETIDLDAVSSAGYAFQIETTYRALRAGFRVVEIPIAFVDRTAGSSKMSRWIVLEAVWRVPLLRLQALAGRL